MDNKKMVDKEQSKQNPSIANRMDKIVSLCKRRGFVFPGSEIYGGLANTWDYGPLGIELRNNIKQLWWNRYVHQRDDIVGLETAIIMNSKVWEASGHTGPGFADPLIECKKCHERYREDQLDERICAICKGADFTEPKIFNILMKTFLGPVEGEKSVAYLRGETAQGMFMDFKQVLDSSRKTLPFGIAQMGKVFRNEITPGNFIFRTREFEQMEIEYFIPEPKSDADWQGVFAYWENEMKQWMTLIGIDTGHIIDYEVPESNRAHYSKRTVDFLYAFPFGSEELYGLAYRTDFDLRNHEKFSGKNLKYKDSETGREFWPHVIEPSWGVDRSLLAVLCEAYAEDHDRVILKLKPYLAPYQAAVFPLLANKPQLVNKAREIYEMLKNSCQLSVVSSQLNVAWDDRGNIGKRYYSQDEIGTPCCVTIDFQTLEDNTVTVRDRDTTKQERVSISRLKSYIIGEILVPKKVEGMLGA